MQDLSDLRRESIDDLDYICTDGVDRVLTESVEVIKRSSAEESCKTDKCVKFSSHLKLQKSSYLRKALDIVDIFSDYGKGS